MINELAIPITATEAEHQLLGCGLAIIQDASDWTFALDSVKPHHFLDPDFGRVWGKIVEIKRAGKPVEGAYIVNELRREGFNAGDILTAISHLQPHTRDMSAYGEQVVEAWRMRQLHGIAERMHAESTGGTDGGADAIITAALQKLARLQAEVSADTGISLTQAMREVVKAKCERDPSRIPTGIAKLDKELGGIPLGMMTLIAGRPGMGKSQLVKQILLNAANAKVPALLVTVEENRQKVAENMLSNLSGIENARIVKNELGITDLQLMQEWASKYEAPFWIEDTAFSLTAVSRVIRRYVAQHGVRMVGIDYIQIIDSELRTDNENRIITQLSQGLKRLIRELGVAGIVAAQLNREGAGGRPKLTNLRGSGSLEQDGDLILLMHREDYYHDEPGYIRSGTVDVDIAKNKGGRRTLVELTFDGDHQAIF